MVVNTKLTINSVTFTDLISSDLTNSMSGNNASSKLNLRFDNIEGRHKDDIVPGDAVEFFADKDVDPAVTRIFSGIVTEVKFDGKEGVKEKMTVMCRDFAALLQRTTVEPEVYTNQEPSVIVNDLMTKYSPSTQITTNNVNATGITLPRIQFKQTVLYDAIKQIAELSDFIFYVDDDKDLHFEERATTDSGITLDSTNVTKSSFKETVEQIRNKIFVYGNRQLSRYPTESFTGDGTGSVFTLINSPHNTDVKVSGVQQVGGIFEINETVASGTDYLVDFPAKKIVFVSGAGIGYSTIPGSLIGLTVDYNISRPLVKLAEDPSSQVKYGVRTEIIIDENIDTTEMAKEIAFNKISLLKDPIKQGSLSVQGVVSATAGNTIVVNLPNEDVSNRTYDILEAKYKFDVNSTFRDEVLTIKVNKHVPDVTDLLKDLLLDVKRLSATNIDTTDVLTRYIVPGGSFGIRVSGWSVKTRDTVDKGNSFILSTASGTLGSPYLAGNGSQIFLGENGLPGFVTVASGGYF